MSGGASRGLLEGSRAPRQRPGPGAAGRRYLRFRHSRKRCASVSLSKTKTQVIPALAGIITTGRSTPSHTKSGPGSFAIFVGTKPCEIVLPAVNPVAHRASCVIAVAAAFASVQTVNQHSWCLIGSRWRR